MHYEFSKKYFNLCLRFFSFIRNNALNITDSEMQYLRIHSENGKYKYENAFVEIEFLIYFCKSYLTIKPVQKVIVNDWDRMNFFMFTFNFLNSKFSEYLIYEFMIWSASETKKFFKHHVMPSLHTMFQVCYDFYWRIEWLCTYNLSYLAL